MEKQRADFCPMEFGCGGETTLRMGAKSAMLDYLVFAKLTKHCPASESHGIINRVTHSFDLGKVRFYVTASQEASRYIDAALFRTALSVTFDIVHLHVQH